MPGVCERAEKNERGTLRRQALMREEHSMKRLNQELNVVKFYDYIVKLLSLVVILPSHLGWRPSLVPVAPRITHIRNR